MYLAEGRALEDYHLAGGGAGEDEDERVGSLVEIQQSHHTGHTTGLPRKKKNGTSVAAYPSSVRYRRPMLTPIRSRSADTAYF
jgi:hypothetical protein